MIPWEAEANILSRISLGRTTGHLQTELKTAKKKSQKITVMVILIVMMMREMMDELITNKEASEAPSPNLPSLEIILMQLRMIEYLPTMYIIYPMYS
mmetsp:Transcript_3323/g.5021  ORF Transcript_3323/g.5021 Transcript_3323/m.5021 type:complete len:97 (+) Transcript_3323:236-526(+)